MSAARKFVLPVIVLALVAGALYYFTRGPEQKTLTAAFPRTVSLYVGSDVRVLGVPVGKVDSVTPSGTDVIVKMSYDADVKVPADASAVIIAPSIVGDRYVQLTPAYDGGAVLTSGKVLGVDRTSTPLELDEIFGSLDRLTVALGPNGANKRGALTDLLNVTAKNFGGQGATFRQTISDVAKLTQTLDDNKDALFDSTAELEKFVNTLAVNDTTVRQFNQSLANVSDLLAGERTELASSIKNLGVALGQVNTFVKTNRGVLGRDITKLNRVAKVLVKRRSELDETLHTAPLALNNLYLTYNPQAGTLDTNANLGNFIDQIGSDPALVLCTVLNQVDTSGQLCDSISSVLPRAGALVKNGKMPQTPDLYDPTLGGLAEVHQ
ncbi:MCE family protein [Nocardioides acrostichi]|uniref:MCE family protein n=1 Tax=Nocardioides acrostichi TaxID=2784339 RepID=A0A930Y7W0_9ACTN|nr:MCE family protein [Nocardioides acrostichi]MBF4162457.1 MCE family protein [Nocardioides acrostichi]